MTSPIEEQQRKEREREAFALKYYQHAQQAAIDKANGRATVAPTDPSVALFNHGVESTLKKAQANYIANTDRTTGETIQDTVVGMANTIGTPVVGAITGAGGALADLAEGVLYNQWDTDSIQNSLAVTNKMSNYLSDKESDVIKAKRENVSYKAQETANRLGGGFLSEAWGTVGAYLDDPTLLAQDVVNSAPALGIGKVATKATDLGLAALNRGLTREALEVAAARAGTSGGQAAANALRGVKLADHAGVGVLSGGMETIPSVASTYQDLVDNGVEGGKALSTAMKYGVAQFAATAGVGAAASRFDLNLFKAEGRASIGRAVNNVIDTGMEAAQEGIENSSSSIVGNLAARETYDPNRDVMQGVGEAFGAGAVTGAATTAALRSPSMAWNTVGAGVTAGTKALSNKYEYKAVDASVSSGKGKAEQYRKNTGNETDTSVPVEDSVLNTIKTTVPISSDPVEQIAVTSSLLNNKTISEEEKVLLQAQAQITAEEFNDSTEADDLKNLVNTDIESINKNIDHSKTKDSTVNNIINKAIASNEDGTTKLGVSVGVSLNLAAKSLNTGKGSEESINKLEKQVNDRIAGGDTDVNLTQAQKIIRAEKAARAASKAHMDAINSVRKNADPKAKDIFTVSDQLRESGHSDFSGSTGMNQKLRNLVAALTTGDQKRIAHVAEDIKRFYGDSSARIGLIKEAHDKALTSPDGTKVKVVIPSYATKRNAPERQWTFHNTAPSSMAMLGVFEADNNYLGEMYALAKMAYAGKFGQEEANKVFTKNPTLGQNTNITEPSSKATKQVAPKKETKPATQQEQSKPSKKSTLDSLDDSQKEKANEIQNEIDKLSEQISKADAKGQVNKAKSLRKKRSKLYDSLTGLVAENKKLKDLEERNKREEAASIKREQEKATKEAEEKKLKEEADKAEQEAQREGKLLLQPPNVYQSKKTKKNRKSQWEINPPDLLAMISWGAGLNREAFRKEGVDPDMFTLRVRGRYLFRKEGGMTPHDLREFMEQENFLKQDTDSDVAANYDNDAVSMVMEALNEDKKFYPIDSEGYAKEQQAHWEATYGPNSGPQEVMDEVITQLDLFNDQEITQEEAEEILKTISEVADEIISANDPSLSQEERLANFDAAIEELSNEQQESITDEGNSEDSTKDPAGESQEAGEQEKAKLPSLHEFLTNNLNVPLDQVATSGEKATNYENNLTRNVFKQVVKKVRNKKGEVRDKVTSFISLSTEKSMFSKTLDIYKELKNSERNSGRKAAEFMADISRVLNHNLNNVMLSEGAMEKLKNGDHNLIKNNRSLHAVEVVTDKEGKKHLRYNSKITEAMAATALQFMAEGLQPSVTDQDSINTDDEGNVLGYYMTSSQLISALATNLRFNLGAKTDRSVPTNITDGFFIALANDLMVAMATPVEKGKNKTTSGMGFFDLVSQFREQSQTNEASTVTHVVPTEKYLDSQSYKNKAPDSLRSMKKALEEVADLSRSKRVAWKLEPPTTKKNVHNSPNAKVSEEQQTANDNMSSVAYKVKPLIVGLLKNISVDAVSAITGQSKYIKGHSSKDFIAKQDAKYLVLESALNTVDDIQNALANPDDPVYFEHHTTFSDRSMMVGAVHPQGNIHFRAMVSHTDQSRKVEIDKLPYGVIAAWAQGLDINIDTNTPDVVKAEVRKVMISGLFQAAARNVLDYSEGNTEDLTHLNQFLTTMPGVTAETIVVLSDYANLLKAKKEGSNEMHVDSYVEVDGKTDGFANAWQLFTPKELTQRTISFDFFSGLFAGLPNNTLGSIQNFITEKLGGKDVYEYSANKINELWKVVKNTPKKEAVNHFFLQMGMFKLNGDNLKIDRKALKQVTTAGGYLEGSVSRANTIVNMLFDHLEELVNSNAELNPEDSKFIKILINSNMSITPESFAENSYFIKSRLGEALKDSKYLGTMETGMAPLLETIQKPLGALVDYTKFASEAAYIYFQESLQEAINEAIAKGDMDKDAPPSPQMISKAILKAVPYMPRITTSYSDKSGIGILKAKNAPTNEQSKMIRGLVEKYAIPLKQQTLFSPDSSAGALSVIGGGDAAMMYALFQDAVKVLNTFDGAQMHPLDLEDYGQRLNNANYENWQNSNTFSDALKHLKYIQERLPNKYQGSNIFESNMDEEDNVYYYSRMPSTKGSAYLAPKGFPSSGPRLNFDQLIKELKRYELETEVNKEFRRIVGSSVGHMAGAETPVNVGGDLIVENPSSNPDELLEQIKNLYRRALPLARDTVEKSFSRNERQSSDLKLVDAFESIGTTENNVTTLSKEDITNLLDSYSFKAPVLHSLWKHVIRPLLSDDLQIHYAQKLGPLMDSAESRGHSIQRGEEGVSNNDHIYIHKLNPRVLIHELFHHATSHIMYSYFADGLKDPDDKPGYYKNQRIAMNNIVKTLSHVMSNQSAFRSDPEGRAFLNILKDITQGKTFSEMTAEEKTELTQEVFAHILTHGKLRKVASTVKTAFRKVSDALMDYYRKLFNIPQGQEINNLLVEMLDSTKELVRAAEKDKGTVPRLQQAQAYKSVQLFRSKVPTELKDKFSNVLNALAARQPTTASETYGQYQSVNLEKKLFKAVNARVNAEEALQHLIKNNLPFSNAEEQEVFQSVYGLLSMPELRTHEFDKVATDISRQILSQGYDVFRTNDDTNDKADINRSKAMHMVFSNRKDGPAILVAYSLVNPEFRNKIDSIKFKETPKETLSNQLKNKTGETLDKLFGLISTNNKDVRTVLDELQTKLENLDEQALISQVRKDSPIIKATDKVTNTTQKIGRKIREVADDLNSNGHETAAIAATAVAALADDRSANDVSEIFAELGSKFNMPRVFTRLFVDAAGSNKSNTDLLAAFQAAKNHIETIRNHLRVSVAQSVAGFFDGLSTEESVALTKGIINTDLSVFDNKKAIKLLDGTSDVNEMIRVRESSLANEEAAKQARELGRFLQNGTGEVAYKNAVSILHNTSVENNKKNLRILDELITLHSLKAMPKEELSLLNAMAKEQGEALNKFINMQRQLSSLEKEKADNNGIHRYNQWKGYAYRQRNYNKAVIIADTSKQAELAKLGWTLMKDFDKSPSDTGPALSYYVSTTATLPSFSSGLIHKISDTGTGSTLMGSSLSQNIHSLLTDTVAVQALKKDMENGTLHPNYIPIYKDVPYWNEETDTSDVETEVIGFERRIDPTLVNNHMAQEEQGHVIMGQWFARQQEEKASHMMNARAVNFLVEHYNSKGASVKFVDISDSEDPIIQDIWNSLSFNVKRQMKEQFPDGRVMIPDAYIEEAVGIRSASVKDIFTGNSKLNKEFRQSLALIANGIMGDKAYKYLSNTEEVWQGTVSEIRKNIIVKLGSVALSNAGSAMLQSMRLGVSPITYSKVYLRKWKETSHYMRLAARIRELEAHSLANPSKANFYKREITSLKNSIQKLSIYPLIREGHLSLQAEGLDPTTQYGLMNDFSGWMDKQLEKVPLTAKTIVDNAFIKENTKLYQGLNRFIMFGDFTAKAVMSEIMRDQGRHEKDIKMAIQDEFVNFTMHPGRTRGFIESLGFINFWNFKLRSGKQIFRALRENPAMAILNILIGNFTPLPIIGGVDTMLDASLWETKWGYSVGQEMLIDASNENLWTNIWKAL
ncbi:uncharacterized protein [Procambarus clarkii]|uniref:uncharacterized protein n=1 Tax=Procambarus clarkii TaxID=6728 RepID=UPI0037442454